MLFEFLYFGFLDPPNAGAIGGVGVTLQLFSTQPPRAAQIFLEQSLIFIIIISFLSDHKQLEKNLNTHPSNQLSLWSSDATLSSDMSDMMYHHCCQMSSPSSDPSLSSDVTNVLRW